MITEFKPINSPYFGKEGLTSTSANSIANRAKHSYEALESKLNAISFFEEKISLIGTDEVNSKVAFNYDAETIEKDLQEIALAKGFCAFLREAIKEKDRLFKEINDFVLPEIKNLKFPEMEPVITEEDVINNMSVSEREHYLTLETLAAVYGKYIHPGQPFAKARQDLMDAIAKPVIVNANGRDTVITKRNPVTTIDFVNKTLNTLLVKHRSFEAELNGIKNSIEEKIHQDEIEKHHKCSVAIEEYKIQMEQLNEKMRKIVDARTEEVTRLKFVIPNKYKELYETLSKTK